MHRWTLLRKCCKTPALLLTDLPVCTSSVSRHWAHELCVGMRFFHALYEREFPPWLLQWARASFRWPSPGKRHWPENTIIHRHIFLRLRRNSNDCMQLKRWGPLEECMNILNFWVIHFFWGMLDNHVQDIFSYNLIVNNVGFKNLAYI